MPIQVTCESCGASFRTDDSAAGKQAPCPKCSGTIQIPRPDQAQTAQEADVYAAEDAGIGNSSGDDRRPCPLCGEMIKRSAVKCRYCGEVFDSSLKGVLSTSGRVDADAWMKVRSGLNTIYNCTGIIFGAAILIGVLAGVLGGLNGGPNGGNAPPALAILFIVGGLVIVGAAIGLLVGYVRCTNVPRESGAYGFALGALICIVGNVVLSTAGKAADSSAISGVGSLISLVGGVLFILFIRQSAIYLWDSDLASSARNFLLFGVAFIVGCFMLGFLSAAGGDAILFILGVGVFVSVIVCLVWFLRLIRGLQATIDLRLKT